MSLSAVNREERISNSEQGMSNYEVEKIPATLSLEPCAMCPVVFPRTSAAGISVHGANIIFRGEKIHADS